MYTFLSCPLAYYERAEIKPIYVRMPDFNQEEIIETNEVKS